jgi:hypothetical protein
MQIRQIDEYTAELYQPPTPHWQLESRLRYKLLEDGTIEMTLECIPRARTFKNDYIGLFFASYIDKPESLDIHFLGRSAEKTDAQPQWICGVTPEHGVFPTHLAVDDNRNFAHDPNFPLTLVFNKSNYRYSEPWYYGVSNGMAFVLMFHPGAATEIRPGIFSGFCRSTRLASAIALLCERCTCRSNPSSKLSGQPPDIESL